MQVYTTPFYRWRRDRRPLGSARGGRSDVVTEASQKRYSSLVSWYRRNTSSSVIRPLLTAVTTAALRRNTHRLVLTRSCCCPSGDAPSRRCSISEAVRLRRVIGFTSL